MIKGQRCQINLLGIGWTDGVVEDFDKKKVMVKVNENIFSSDYSNVRTSPLNDVSKTVADAVRDFVNALTKQNINHTILDNTLRDWSKQNSLPVSEQPSPDWVRRCR